jgi:hypothetical protein
MTTLATSYLKVPRVCPYRFHLNGVGDFFVNEIPHGETKVGYCIKDHWGAYIYFQYLSLKSSLGLTTVDICDASGTSIHILETGPMDTLTKVDENYYCYYAKGNYPLPGVHADGVYYLRISFEYSPGLYKVLYSEPINLKTSHTDVIEIEYEHTKNDFDVIWTDPKSSPMFLRLVGGMHSDGFTPGGKFTMYENLKYQPVILRAVPFNIEKFTFGDSRGIPNWVAERISRLFACDKVYINDIQYSRNEGAKLEKQAERGFPLAVWDLELIRSFNEQSDEFAEEGLGDTWKDEGVWKDSGKIDETPITFNATPETFNTDNTAKTLSVAITSNTTWTAVSDSVWAVPTPMGGDNESCDIAITENTGTERVAVITITPVGETPVDITITQTAP